MSELFLSTLSNAIGMEFNGINMDVENLRDKLMSTVWSQKQLELLENNGDQTHQEHDFFTLLTDHEIEDKAISCSWDPNNMKWHFWNDDRLVLHPYQGGSKSPDAIFRQGDKLLVIKLSCAWRCFNDDGSPRFTYCEAKQIELNEEEIVVSNEYSNYKKISCYTFEHHYKRTVKKGNEYIPLVQKAFGETYGVIPLPILCLFDPEERKIWQFVTNKTIIDDLRHEL